MLPRLECSNNCSTSAAFAAVCQAIFDQCDSVLTTITAEDYARAPVNNHGESSSPIGEHMRHIIGFLQQFRDAVVNQDKIIDYDARNRDVPFGYDLASTRQEFSVLQTDMLAIANNQMQLVQAINVRESAIPGHIIDIPSTIGREFLYVSTQHTVHHLAIIKSIASDMGYALDRQIGVAASTLKFRNS